MRNRVKYLLRAMPASGEERTAGSAKTLLRK